MNNFEDILDINGKNNNFLNNKPFSESYKELAKKWSLLPMYKNTKSVKQFFNLLNDCQVILLVSGTGSGKTVLVPKFVLKYVISNNLSGKIAITNPKILTTIYNAEYGAKTLDVNLGEEVGYKYKGAPDNASNNNTKLLYCTDGIILATLLGRDPLLKDYQSIIIDEAHERQVNIDLLLRLIKELLPKRPDFKLIIMSATINSSVFRNYFNESNIKFGEIEISGESNFPITQNWLDSNTKVNRTNYTDLAVKKCLDILKSSNDGDIIVFVATQKDAYLGCQQLHNKCPSIMKNCNKIYCIEVYSKMNQSNKDLAVSKDLYKSKGYNRKVIFATNVAESSITFDGLVYVIDSGYELANYYEANDNSYIVTKTYTSQAQVKQRIGRAGRTKPGIAYHLYQQKTFNTFKQFPEPNILVIDLTDFILSLINYSRTIIKTNNLIKGFITIPKIEQIVNSIYKLFFIRSLKLIKHNGGALDELSEDSIYESSSIQSLDSTDKSESIKEDIFLDIDTIEWNKIKSFDKINKLFNGCLNQIGISILKLRSTSVLSGLAIIMAKYMDCQLEIIKIMSILELCDGKIESLFEFDKSEKEKMIKYYTKAGVDGSDHLTILNIYNNFYLNDMKKYLNLKLFEKIDKRIEQLTKYAKKIKDEKYQYMKLKYNIINSEPYKIKEDNILYILGISHYFNLLQREAKDIYTSLNFINNSTTQIEYSCFIPPIKMHTTFVICNSLINAFGNKSFICISQIPNYIIFDIINKEKLYKNHNEKFKKYIKKL